MTMARLLLACCLATFLSASDSAERGSFLWEARRGEPQQDDEKMIGRSDERYRADAGDWQDHHPCHTQDMEPVSPSSREQATTAIRATGGKATELRVAILAWFHTHPATVTAQDLEQHFSDQANRVSIYRTLEWLEERGLIHRIASTERAWSFALGDGSHRHVHFTCTSCGRSNCLGRTAVAAPQLPPGYRSEEIEVVVHGICDRCTG